MRKTKCLVLAASLYASSLWIAIGQAAAAPDKLVGVHSSRVMSQSFPWVAQEAGLFKKYNHRLQSGLYLVVEHRHRSAAWRRR